MTEEDNFLLDIEAEEFNHRLKGLNLFQKKVQTMLIQQGKVDWTQFTQADFDSVREPPDNRSEYARENPYKLCVELHAPIAVWLKMPKI